MKRSTNTKAQDPWRDLKKGDRVRCTGKGPRDQDFTGITGIYQGLTTPHGYAIVFLDDPRFGFGKLFLHPESLERVEVTI